MTASEREPNGDGSEQYDTYCIRCGKPLSRSEAYYSRYDPDCEESMCRKCYERYEKSFESEE